MKEGSVTLLCLMSFLTAPRLSQSLKSGKGIYLLSSYVHNAKSAEKRVFFCRFLYVKKERILLHVPVNMYRNRGNLPLFSFFSAFCLEVSRILSTFAVAKLPMRDRINEG